MRQLLSFRKVIQLRRKTGLDIISAMVQGGTNHRIDLCIRGGKTAYLWPDGTIEESDQTQCAKPIEGVPEK